MQIITQVECPVYLDNRLFLGGNKDYELDQKAKRKPEQGI